MRKLSSLRYSCAIGSAGAVLLALKIFRDPAAALDFLRPEYLILTLLYSILDYAGMYVRAGVAVSLSFTSVMVAYLIGGETPALLVGLGAIPLIWTKGRQPIVTFFNVGVHILAARAASRVVELLGRQAMDGGYSLDPVAVAAFASAYTLAGSLIVGIYAIMNFTKGRVRDQTYNLGIHVIHMVIATSVGVFGAVIYRMMGFLIFFLSCATVSAMAALIAQSTRTAINRGGLFALYKAASSINETLTLNEVFARAKDFALTLLDVDFAWLSISGASDDGPPIRCTWAADGVDGSLAAAYLSSLAGSERHELEEGFQVITTPNRAEKGYLGLVATTPLCLGHETIGEFGLGFLTKDVHIPRDTAQIFAVLSSHLALAVDNALKFERVTMLAYTDPLTGLYNYRHFQYLLEDSLSRAEKSGTPVSLIYIDLDYFRDINNTYGHQVGDEALKAIARVVRDSCRDNDLVSRPGGDEFTVILPGVGKEQAKSIARRIRDNLKSAKLDVRLEKPLIGVVGASVGVAAYPEDGRDAGELVRKADMDMYKGKPEGGRRNR